MRRAVPSALPDTGRRHGLGARAAIRRVWTAYRIEVGKAVRQRYTYVGPVLVMLAVLSTALVRGIECDGTSDYDFIAYATPLALNVIGLVLLLAYCAGLVAVELGNGAFRMMALRPVLRHELLLAKLFLGMTYAAVLMCATAGTAWLAAFSFGELGGVTYGGELAYTSREMAVAYLAGMLLGLGPLFAAAACAIMVSCLTRSPSAAIGSTLGFGILIEAVKHPLRVAPLLFSTYIETPWQVFESYCNGWDARWLPAAVYCGVSSAAWMVVCTAIAGYALTRRDLVS